MTIEQKPILGKKGRGRRFIKATFRSGRRLLHKLCLFKNHKRRKFGGLSQAEKRLYRRFSERFGEKRWFKW